MHQMLLEVTKDNVYNNSKVCAVINIGSTVCEFFNIYHKYEPEALEQYTELMPLLHDLNKGRWKLMYANVVANAYGISNLICIDKF